MVLSPYFFGFDWFKRQGMAYDLDTWGKGCLPFCPIMFCLFVSVLQKASALFFLSLGTLTINLPLTRFIGSATSRFDVYLALARGRCCTCLLDPEQPD